MCRLTYSYLYWKDSRLRMLRRNAYAVPDYHTFWHKEISPYEPIMRHVTPLCCGFVREQRANSNSVEVSTGIE